MSKQYDCIVCPDCDKAMKACQFDEHQEIHKLRTLLAKQELTVKRYREALEDIKKVSDEYTIKGQYKGDLRLLWVYEKCEKALEEKGS